MRLDAVFVTAPKAKDPAMPTRRAFLLAGCTFTLGTAVGGACGYSLGSTAMPVATPRPEEDLPSSGDVELDELRRLAVKAPIAELVEKRQIFMVSLWEYKTDDILWKGVDRLSDAVLRDPSFPDRRIFAAILIQTFQKAAPDRRSKYVEVERSLRTVR